MKNYINKVIQGDCLIKLKELEDNSIDSIATDPPAGISFMGKSWDTDKGGRDNWIKWMQEVATECKRVLKPGGHAFVWAIPRTSHWTATAWENAGFEIRDVVAHVFGSGFPKSLNIGKAVDKIQGNEREIVGETRIGKTSMGDASGWDTSENMKAIKESGSVNITKGTSEWEGWGTALKPAREDWILMRKPLDKGLTIAENCLKWGTGGINIDESRVGTEDTRQKTGGAIEGSGWGTKGGAIAGSELGRFPANLLHDNSEEVRECFPETGKSKRAEVSNKGSIWGSENENKEVRGHDDNGGNASRYFKSILYYPKASKSERNKNTNNYLIIEICVDNTEVAQLQPKVILEKTELWFTELFGKEKMEEYQMDFKSTTKTETKKTTILVILNYSQHLNIKEYIVGAIKTKTENGGSPVASVANISEWRAIITDELMAYLLGVNPVVSPTQLRISVNTNNFHSTVKPTALMSYLIKMITPKGGIVLDPFAGSGSTLVAAKQNGYKYIGIELTEEYIPIIEARLSGVENDLFKDIL